MQLIAFRKHWPAMLRFVDLPLHVPAKTLMMINLTVFIILVSCVKTQARYHPRRHVLQNNNVHTRGLFRHNDSIPRVTGRVMGDRGPLEGVSVTVKNTPTGTFTNRDGEYELRDVDADATLVFSSVGYFSREEKVDGRSLIYVQLLVSVSRLDETVVIGYGTTTRRLNTGNVSKVSGQEIEKQSVSNPLQAMQGRMPGVYIQQTTGVTGGAFNIQVRGRNSLRSAGNDPLYLIDGVPFTSTSLNSIYTSGIIKGGNPLMNINPNDISSIEVLKDADATAIYGSRGANGVVLITTKKAKGGPTNFEINISKGTGEVGRRADLLNTSQYLEMRREAFRNDDAVPNTSNALDLVAWDTTRDTDWQEKLIGGLSQVTHIQAGISGGEKNTRFLINAGYHQETTVFPGEKKDYKVSALFNLQHISPNQKFRIDFSGNYVSDNNNLTSQDFTGKALSLAPDAPAIWDEEGKLNWENSTWENPYSYILQDYRIKSDNLLANADLSYAIVPGLEISSRLGYTKMQTKEIQLHPTTSMDPSSGPVAYSIFANAAINTFIIEPQLEYSHQWNKNKFSVLAGGTIQQNTREQLTQMGYGFASDALLENILAAASLYNMEALALKYRYIAVFGRLNYNYNEKYLVNMTFRRDGSSRFGPGRQFANFGAAGIAWIFSKEAFFTNKVPWLSFGKLRASYGTTGSDQTGDYQFLDLWSSTANPYLGAQGLVPDNLRNPQFGWETNHKLEGGIELEFLKERVGLAASFYRNQSSDQLVGVPMPWTTGFSSIQANFPATVLNTGWEFEVRSRNIQAKSFQWTTNINITFSRNKLLRFPDFKASAYTNTYIVGQPLSIAKIYAYEGVDPQTGLYGFTDANLDGIISYSRDAIAIKNIAPRFYGGCRNSISFKNFSLDVFFQFVRQTGRNYLSYSPAPGTARNQPAEVLNRWQREGDKTEIQRFAQEFGSPALDAYSNLFYSRQAITDASFIRLKNISLSWSLPESWMKKAALKNGRIYFQGQNLLTITNYLGLDPETQTNSLPPLRVLTAGFQITI